MGEWIVMLHLLAVNTCGTLFVPEDSCVPYVLECLLDGESEQWCLEDYLGAKDE